MLDVWMRSWITRERWEFVQFTELIRIILLLRTEKKHTSVQGRAPVGKPKFFSIRKFLSSRIVSIPNVIYGRSIFRAYIRYFSVTWFPIDYQKEKKLPGSQFAWSCKVIYFGNIICSKKKLFLKSFWRYWLLLKRGKYVLL